MLKELIKILVKLVEAKIKKTGMEEEILNHKKYIDTAKEIWGIVDEQFRVTQNVEEKLSSKADEFNKRFLKEHPEVSKEDVEYFRQAVAGEMNQGKQAVLENSEILKKLQEENQELKSKNIDLESKLAAISNYVPVENK
ncbi:TPA: hypothetical protein ACGSDT_002845 [Clostridium perfringens]|nr:hypothetical protein [Clostridium perfringens]MDU3995124.1 hypothetical protein [Enterobacter sp.]EJT6483678.1 hypothetical protein [Clostridium perfringens]ELP5178129.1 hypothetical protein [Clostridium perfringens]BDA23757.1 hypothetical protein CPBEC1_29670 [Clostridium perfringens]